MRQVIASLTLSLAVTASAKPLFAPLFSPLFAPVPAGICPGLLLSGCILSDQPASNADDVGTPTRGAVEHVVDAFPEPVFPQVGVKNINDVRLVQLAAPDWALGSKGTDPVDTPTMGLAQTKFEDNQITDTDQWFFDNDLSLSIYTVPNPYRNELGNLPAAIPTKYRGNSLIKAIHDGNIIHLIYDGARDGRLDGEGGPNFSQGRFLISYDIQSGMFLRGFDFFNYTFWPDQTDEYAYIWQSPVWVQQREGMLFVSTGHRTYAKSSLNRNGYITALDAKTGDVLWRSSSLVSNAANFEVLGDTIVSGYGFTAEEDYLFLLNKFSGEVEQKIELKTAADYIIRKADRLFVRTYDSDYEFRVFDLEN